MFNNELWQKPAGGAGGDFYTHQIAKSCKFVSGSSSYLTRTPSGAPSSDKICTISFWYKHAGQSGSNMYYFTAYSSDSSVAGIYRYPQAGAATDDQIRAFSAGDTSVVQTSNQFRDFSAWGHLVLRIDTTQSTNTDRVRWYHNGVLVDISSSGLHYPDQNETTVWNGQVAHLIGGYKSSQVLPYDGYFAEFIMADGQSYAPTQFGESKNGVWIPKDPSGTTFGNNGFHLDFADSSALGNDVSGNNNDFSASGLGTDHCMLDSPTFNSSSNGGNFATLNPLSSSPDNILTEGNLKATKETGANYEDTAATMNLKGKYYVECCVKELMGDDGQAVGLVNVEEDLITSRDGRLGETGVSYRKNGKLMVAGTENTFGSTWSAGDIVQMAVDMTDINSVKVWFGLNNTWQNSGNPSAGSGIAATITNGEQIMAMSAGYSGSGELIFNFGQDGTFAGEKTAQGNSDATGYGNFYYSPPTNFLALCTGNLPVADAIDPAQTDDNFPQQLFDAQLWTGNGSSGRAITISGAKKPSLSVIKQRNSSNGWNVWTQGYNSGDYDSFGEFNSTGAWNANQGSSGPYTADPTASTLTLTAYGQVNASSNTYVNYRWIANGGTTSTNTTGATNSVTEADPSGCFSVVSYTGTGSGTTLGHSLSAAPKMIIVKRTDSSGDWWVYQQFMSASPQTSYMKLSKAEALATGDGGIAWNSTAPTSSVFSIGNTNDINASSGTFVAFCFADCEGYIKSGAYEGNGNADGAFIYTGFKPAWILYKSTTAQSWVVIDNARNTFNVAAKGMFTEANNAESDSTVTYGLDILSNGFKMRGTNNASNGSNTYIYLAMAKNPFKYATAR